MAIASLTLIARQLRLGINRAPGRLVFNAIAGITIGWTAVDLTMSLFALTPPGLETVAGLVAVGIVAGIVSVAAPVAVSRRIPSSGTTVSVRFGDLWTEGGLRVIGVNEFFDSSLGTIVSPQSLHGQLIGTILDGGRAAFDASARAELDYLDHEYVPRQDGNMRRYPIGTTTVVRGREGSFLCVALAHTDTSTDKAYASLADLLLALQGVWQRARVEANGDKIVLPLLGAGLSGVGLPPQQLLACTLISLAAETKRTTVASQIVVILAPHLIDAVDLTYIARVLE